MLYVVTGPPAAGKSTWVTQHARRGDITIDYDAIASVLTPLEPGERQLSAPVAAVTRAARRAAIDMALEYRDEIDVYIIHATPSAGMLRFYQRMNAKIVTVDPGEDVVLARCRDERPWQMGQAAKKWYRSRTDPAEQAPSGTPVMPW